VKIAGIGVSSGRCAARIHLYGDAPDPAALSRTAHDPQTARRLLDEAIERSREALIGLELNVTERAGAETASIFAAHRMILEDREWLAPIWAGIDAGEPVAAAVWRASEQIVVEFRQLANDYMRERATDIIDVARRVIEQLGCATRAVLPSAEGGKVVLVAEELGPSDTVGLDPSVVVGIAMEMGARTSHAAILARQLGIPAAVGIPGLMAAARDAQTIALDGDSGACELDPTEETARRFRYARVADPVIAEAVSTVDGIEVAVCANASSAEDVARAVAMGADGVGLYRTEFMFLRSLTLPTEEQQVAEYCAAAEAGEGRPVVFRALDVGADKQVPGLSIAEEENPFLGLRGIRLLLERRAVFEAQLRAMIHTAERHQNVSLMLPMISDPEELRRVRAIASDLGGRDLRLGTMIEVPSAAILTREMAPLVDFFSVGSNDLTGYILAVDRTNTQVAKLFNELHPAVLRVLRMIATGADELRTPLSICGELAGDPAAVSVLIGLGYRSLSVAPALVPRIKAAVRATSAEDARELARRASAAAAVGEVSELLSAPTRDKERIP
jgi:phosphoenolpyruvate-protein phosphotransferase